MIKKIKVIFENSLDFNEESFQNMYDLIFIDPPFLEKKIKEIFLFLDHCNLLKKNGVGFIHRNKNHKERLPQNVKIIDERNYGVSKILFFSLD